MRTTEALENARREMEICNACRYCEGYCAVFPAMELRREFTNGDLSYLANLCHNCRACYYACQYAPPHEWGVNVPRAMAKLRAETYAEYAWPRPLAEAFNRNGVLVSLVTALGIALVLILTMVLNSPATLFTARPVVPDAFYAVIPLWSMQLVGLLTFLFSLFAMGMGAVNFWRDAGGREHIGPHPVLHALNSILSLRYLGGAGHGCNDNSERFSMTRRWLHHGMFYGFFLCFAATCTGYIYHAFFGWAAPYPFISMPVLLGTVGGVLLLIGTIGLFAMKFVDDPMPAARNLLGGDIALIMLLALVAFTGLLLLAFRTTGAMSVLLAVHLGFILGFFVVLPYSKMVHGVYRSAALLRWGVEHNRKPVGGGE